MHLKEKYKLLIKDTFVFAIGSLGSKLILFFLVPLYTNFLTTSEYGKADLVYTFSSLVVPFSALAINEAVIRFGMMKNIKKEDVLLSSYVVLLFSILSSFFICYMLRFYPPLTEWWGYLFIYVVLSNISEVEKSYLKVKNQNRAFAILSIIQTALLALSNVLLLTILKTGIEGYLTSSIIAIGCTAIITFFAAKIPIDLKNSNFNTSLLKKMIAFSCPLIFNTISWWVIHSCDKIMIERMVDDSSLGLYTAASKIPSLINVIIGIFNQAWGLSSIREEESGGDNQYYADVFEKFNVILFLAAIGFTTIIKYFMSIYVGKEFINAWQYVPLLLSSAVFYSISAFIGSLYSALQKSLNNMWTMIICAASNFIINVLFIPQLGVWGAIIGTVVSYFIIAIIRLIDIKRLITFKISNTRFIVNIAIMLIHALLVSLNVMILPVSFAAIICFVLNNKNIILNYHLLFKKR